MNLLLHDRTAKEVDRLLLRPAHAVIIAGPSGSGKATLARDIAGRLLNISPEKLSNDQNSKIIGGTADSISIDNIRELQHFLSRKSAGTRGTIHRVALVIDADRMTAEAQNALLKTLEEPPADAVILMTGHDEQALLTTVRSRSRIITVTTPEREKLTKYFANDGFDQAAISRALLMSGGLPGLMTALLQQDTAHPLAKAAGIARSILSMDTFGRLTLIDTLAKQHELCRDTLFILQQMAALSLKDATKSIAAQKQWRMVLAEAFATEQTLATTNANAKLTLTHLMLAL